MGKNRGNDREPLQVPIVNQPCIARRGRQHLIDSSHPAMDIDSGDKYHKDLLAVRNEMVTMIQKQECLRRERTEGTLMKVSSGEAMLCNSSILSSETETSTG